MSQYPRLSRLGAVLPVLLVVATPALAQIGCIAFVANQPTVRQEGTAEAVGDVLLACNGTPYGAQTQSQTLSLYTTYPTGPAVTSRQLYTGSIPQSIPTEAALLINDCTSTTGVSPTYPSFACTNSGPTQGFLQDGALVFTGFTLPQAASEAFQLRITNVRVDANALASGTFIYGTVLATFPIQNQAGLILGVVESSLSVSVSPELNFSGCSSLSTSIGTLTIGELFNTAFKSPAASASNSTPGGWYQYSVNTESQTVLSSTPSGWTNQLTGAIPGQADHATRIRVNLSNIPAGVTVLMPVNVTNSSGSGSLVATSGGDLGPFSTAIGTQIPVTSSGSVTYEVRSQFTVGTWAFQFPIAMSSAGNVGAGTILISATYAGTTAENSAEIPTFADTSVLTPLVSFTGCLGTDHLVFSQLPFRGPVGSAIPLLVVVVDGNGNPVTSSNAAITVASAPAGASATVSAVNGIAAFSNDLIFNTAGNYAFSASASGIDSVTSNAFLIAGEATTMSLSLSANSATYGQSVKITANVSPAAASGTVTFYDGTTILETEPLVSGYAVLNTSLLPSGVRTISAIYSGDATYAPSTIKGGAQTVNPVASSGLTGAVNYPAGTSPQSMAAGDFNGDGKTDLAVADSNGVSVLLGNGDGTFQPALSYSAGVTPASIAVGDFNGDGKTDIVFVNSGSNRVSVLLGNGDGTFQTPVSYLTESTLYSASSLAVADFNGDGKADLVVGIAAGVSVLLGNGDGTFQTAVDYASALGLVIDVAVGDFNGDGWPDLAAVNLSNNVNVLLGNGDGTFRTAVGYAVGSPPTWIAVGDFNGDGATDIVANGCCNSVSVLLGNGDATFQGAVSYATVLPPILGTVADLNGDGKPDILVAGSGLSVLLGSGNGTFQSAVTYSGVANAGSAGNTLVVGDFNGDGRADIAASNNTGTVSVLLGTNATTPTISSVSPNSATAGGGELILFVYGTNFTAESLVVFDGFPLSTTFIGGSELSAVVPAALTTFAESVSITVQNPGSATSPAVTFTILNRPPILSISKTHTGNFTQGQTGAVYTVTVSNSASGGPTSGTVMVTETVPPGMTLQAMAGSGWTCPANGTTCTRYDALAAGSSYPAITVTVNMASNAGSPLSNSVSVSGGGSATSGTTDTTIILQSQTITFGALSNQLLGLPAFTVSATATSGLAVSFASTTSPVCTVSGPSGATVTLVSTGTCSITASQAGNATYAAAPSVPQSFTVAQPPPPSAVSVSPSSGSGISQTFSFVFTDPLGYQDMVWQQIIINSGLTAAGGCYIYYSPSSNQIYLGNNSGSGTLGPQTLGTSGTLQNSQCVLNVGSSTASDSGNLLFLNLALTFESGFTGAKTIWADTDSNAGLSMGWQSLGTWTPGTAAPPSATSVSPSSGSGISQTFSFTFADPLGYQDMAWQQIIINSGLTAAGGCYIYYSPSSNQIYLGNNSGSGTLGPQTLGTSGTLQNSQCVLNVGSSTATGSGNNLTLNLAFTFESGFMGAKTIWADTASNAGLSMGWQTLGTWTPGTAAPPSATSVSPSSGGGISQTFSFVFTDSSGYPDMAWQQIIINSGLTAAEGCYIYYSPSSNQIYLGNNSGSGTLGPQTVGTSGTLQNSQCILNVGSSTATGSGNNLTLNLALTFESGFTGAKNVWADTASNAGLSMGWQSLGTWTPGTASPPSATSVSPSSGSGTSQTFSFTFADPVGYQDMAWQQIIINSGLTAAGGCYIYYSPSSNQIYLGNNSGSGTLGPQTLGTSGTLQNSQCVLNVGSSTATGSGNNLTLNLALTFESGFTGAKNVWADTASNAGLSMGWQSLGTWTPGTASPPSATSVSPSSGSGISQTFSFTFADPLGYQDMAWQQIIINSGLTAAGGCYIYYSPSSNQIYLGNNSASGTLGPQTLATSGTLQNSQCVLNVGSSTATGSGNNLTLNLALTFESGFTGAKTIWADTASNAGLTMGWQTLGTWTPGAAGPPSAVSVSPSSGSGISQTFSFVFADPLGYQDMVWQQIIINSGLTATGGCYIYYSPSTNQIYLGNNSGSGTLGPQTLGTSGTLQNSQCVLNVGSSTATGSGNNLTLNLAFTFESGFTGGKNVWADTASNGGTNSGWESLGSWTP